MLLILMRSAECVPLEAGQRDSERALTDSGFGDVISSAIFVNSLGLDPKVILSSPFKRTKQTADILSEHLSNHPPVITAASIMPGSGVEELMRAVISNSDAGSDEWVVAVGHQPDIGMTLKELLEPANQFNLPVDPGSIFGIIVQNINGRLSGQLMFQFSPKAMRA
ncbi:MAG TPA: hypothetical protein DCZ94_21220 [Lentisphaeria bacterium]|nr:MAG: hypothetical protein A2X48_16545 [Lentisphaerae bacterium GWF2_49_21]HBC89467.1 hypothetical protein [Lentisphaeria bacterium]